MLAFLDGRALNGTFATLEDAMRAAAAGAGDRLITEAHADGVPVPVEDLVHPPARPDYAREVRFVSAHPAELACAALQEAARELESLRPRQARIADRIRTGEIAGGLNELHEVLTSWEKVRGVLQLARRAMATASGEAAPDAGVDRAVESLAAELRELHRSLAVEDWATASDQLAYSMEEMAIRWHDLFLTLGARAANAGAAGNRVPRAE